MPARLPGRRVPEVSVNLADAAIVSTYFSYERMALEFPDAILTCVAPPVGE